MMHVSMNYMSAFLPLLLTVTTVVVALSVSKDYIDLLELRDNDEFLWRQPATSSDKERAPSNVLSHFTHNNNYHNNGSNARYKRQASGSGGIQLQENKAYGACATPEGEPGQCRHIIYCRLPELKNDVWRLVQQLCLIERSSIGICCPERIVSRIGPQIVGNGVNDPRIVNQSPEQRGCGISTKQLPRVTGGRPAESDEWPWMAALLRPGQPYVWCGGVLITDRLILTAAHCIHKINKDEMFVRLGEYNTEVRNDTRSRDFAISSMVTHIDYDALTFEHDIALVRIERPTLFNTYIWPVCMPPLGENWEGRVGVVTGWGTQIFGGPHSDILMEVLLPVWKQDDCKRAMIERIPDTVLCAGLPAGGQDSCQGDSGGPLLVQLPNERWVTIGIVSWGVRCGERNRPGMYTRVDKYLHWIIQNSDI